MRIVESCGATAIFLAAGAAGADPVAVDFTAVSKSASAAYMTDKTNGVLSLTGTWEPVAAPGSPFDGISGDCFGSARMIAGRMTGDGYCGYKDKDGETLLIRWWLENTAAPVGSWLVAGGTGKWATASGGGAFADSEPDANGVSKSHIVGTVDLK